MCHLAHFSRGIAHWYTTTRASCGLACLLQQSRAHSHDTPQRLWCSSSPRPGTRGEPPLMVALWGALQEWATPATRALLIAFARDGLPAPDALPALPADALNEAPSHPPPTAGVPAVAPAVEAPRLVCSRHLPLLCHVHRSPSASRVVTRGCEATRGYSKPTYQIANMHTTSLAAFSLVRSLRGRPAL